MVGKLELLLAAAIDTAATSRRGELLPLWADAPGPVHQPENREMGRRTAPHPMLRSYDIGQRLPSRADLAAVAWPARSDEPPSSRPGTWRG